MLARVLKQQIEKQKQGRHEIMKKFNYLATSTKVVLVIVNDQ